MKQYLLNLNKTFLNFFCTSDYVIDFLILEYIHFNRCLIKRSFSWLDSHAILFHNRGTLFVRSDTDTCARLQISP
jgi:hypothetical protein